MCRLFLTVAVAFLSSGVSALSTDDELQLQRVRSALFILDRHNTSAASHRKSPISAATSTTSVTSSSTSSSSSSSSSSGSSRRTEHEAFSAARERRQAPGVYDSVACSARNSCQMKVTSEASGSNKPSAAQSAPRNCYCDALCIVYNDCCADIVHFRNNPTRKQQTTDDAFDAVPVSALPAEVVSCENVPELRADGAEIYIVRACPKSFSDQSVTSFCESSYEAIEESFFGLPVSGVTSRVLYANFFCALCNGDTNVTFWQATVNCNRFHHASVTAAAHDPTGANNVILRHVLRHFATHDCEMEFRHPDARYSTRTCISHIGRCDKSWPDDDTRRQCRGHTAYVFAGVRAFRNRFCAMCNYVNASYLSCDDRRPALVAGSIPLQQGAGQGGSHAFTAMIDVNVGRAVIRMAKVSPEPLHRHQHSADNGTMEEVKVDFLKCLIGHIYDPFADVCRRLKCTDGYVFRDNVCVMPATRLSPGQQSEDGRGAREKWTSIGTTSIPVSPSFLTSYLSPVTSTPSTSVVQPSAVDRSCVTGVQKNSGGPVEVCLEVSATSTNASVILRQSQSAGDGFSENYVTMFQFSEPQKILSLAAGIVSSTTLLIHLLIYSASVSLKQSVRARCHVSLCSALALAQCTYVVRDALHDLLPPSVCTLVAVAMHYSHLTSFFWLTCSTLTLYQAFSVKQRTSGSEESFRSLSLVCWLLPAFIAGVSLAVHVLASPYFTAPVYLYRYCWLCNIHAFVSAFLAPAGLTVLVNFILCVCIVRKTRQQSDSMSHHNHNGYSYDAVEMPSKEVGQGQGYYSRSPRGSERSPSTSSVTNGCSSKRVRVAGGSLATPLVVTCPSSTSHRRSLTTYVALLILMTSSWITAILTIVWPQNDPRHSSAWFVFIGCQATIGPLICITFSFAACKRRRHKDSHRGVCGNEAEDRDCRKCSMSGSVSGTPCSRQNGGGGGVEERNGRASVRWTDELVPPPSVTLARKELKVVARETSI